jgi:hypothetical protein
LLTNLRGTVVKADSYLNGQVDVFELTTGTYLMTVTAGKQVYHQKFVKQ